MSIKYFDTASTTKIHESVLDSMKPYLTEYFGNPSSKHDLGEKSKQAIDKARIEVSKVIYAQSTDKIIFTSGATESINMALKGIALSEKYKGNHILTSSIEHKATLETCSYLETIGFDVTYIDPDENGELSIDTIKNHITEKTSIIALMLVNNETGVINPIKEVSKVKMNSVLFTDATQAIGKIPVDVNDLGVDLLCFSAHKIYGPKGIGALYVKSQIDLLPLIHGGGQENGLRGGTQNTPQIVGFGKACELINTPEKTPSLNSNLRKETIAYVESLGAKQVLTSNKNIVPNILCFNSGELDAQDFLIKNRNNFFASTGSSCNSRIEEASHVYKKIFKEEANKIFRISI